jgi:hypothetical protein
MRSMEERAYEAAYRIINQDHSTPLHMLIEELTLWTERVGMSHKAVRAIRMHIGHLHGENMGVSNELRVEVLDHAREMGLVT